MRCSIPSQLSLLITQLPPITALLLNCQRLLQLHFVLTIIVFHCIIQEAESFYLALKHGSIQISHSSHLQR